MKTRAHSLVSITTLALLSLLGIQSASAANFTWTGNSAATQDWNQTSNWGNGTVYSSPGSTTDSLIFFADTTTALANGNNSITANVTTPLSMNVLTLNGLGATSSNVTVGTSGADWTLGGTTPTVNLNGLKGTALNYTIASNLALSANTTFTGNGTAAFNFSGNITGAGGMTKTGNSIVALSGNNTFGGKLAISAGTLQYTSVSALGSGTTSIDVGGAQTSLTYTGAGSAINNRDINITSSNGFISNSSANLLTLSGNITLNNRAVTLRPSNGNITVTGLITGTGGSLAITAGLDAPVVTLANASNSFTGNVSVNRGILSIASIANSGSNSTLGAGSTITFGQAATNGALQFTGLSGGSSNRTISIAGNTTFGGIIENTVAGQTLTLSGNVGTSGTGTSSRLQLIGAGNGVLSGNITNATGSLALTKSGTGTWTLSGTNSYTGNTTVSTGTLLINGNSSAANGTVTVAVGATLGGNGTIGGATTVGGNLNPGNSPGLLTFASSLTLNSTATTTMEINATAARGTDFDGINVGTTLTYGGNLTLAVGTTFGVGSYTWNLFDFNTSQSGNFANVAISGNYTGAFTGPSSGNWTLTQANGFGGNNTWTFAQGTGDLGLNVVPEPATWALLAGTLTVVMVLRRRRI